MNASLSLSSVARFFSVSTICCHINTHRGRTEVIVSHTNELLLRRSDSSSLWPETDPRLHLQSENLHLQHHRLLHNTASNNEPKAKPLHILSITLPPSCGKSNHTKQRKTFTEHCRTRYIFVGVSYGPKLASLWDHYGPYASSECAPCCVYYPAFNFINSAQKKIYIITEST